MHNILTEFILMHHYHRLSKLGNHNFLRLLTHALHSGHSVTCKKSAWWFNEVTSNGKKLPGFCTGSMKVRFERKEKYPVLTIEPVVSGKKLEDLLLPRRLDIAHDTGIGSFHVPGDKDNENHEINCSNFILKITCSNKPSLLMLALHEMPDGAHILWKLAQSREALLTTELDPKGYGVCPMHQLAHAVYENWNINDYFGENHVKE